MSGQDKVVRRGRGWRGWGRVSADLAGLDRSRCAGEGGREGEAPAAAVTEAWRRDSDADAEES